jgi:hypothetical protein
MAQEVELLSSKHTALSSNYSTEKQYRTKQKSRSLIWIFTSWWEVKNGNSSVPIQITISNSGKI